jgi:hypothetical protein
MPGILCSIRLTYRILCQLQFSLKWQFKDLKEACQSDNVAVSSMSHIL